MAAAPVRKTEFAGIGALVQLLGLVVIGLVIVNPLAFIPGIVVGLIMLVIGSRMALRWVCSECRNRLDSKDVKVCPACHVRFD